MEDLEPVAASFKEYAAQRGFDILSLDKQELRRQDKLFELANFERNYVTNLQTLKSRVIDPLRERKVFPELHMDVLFSNVEDILALHKEFLHHLVTQQKDRVVIDRLHGENNFLGRLAIYKEYAEAHDRQRKRLLELQKQPEFREFLENAWQKMERKDVDLYSYLSLPFYQVVQYPPILSKIIKNTPENHPDAKHLVETIPAAATLANKCREIFLAVQNSSRLQELADQVQGFDVLKPGREFIREGVVEIIDARPHKRYAFLFNDVLLLARARGRSYRAIRAIPVRKAIYGFPDEKHGKDELQILFDYNQLAVLRFPVQFRAMWYKALKALQGTNPKKFPKDVRIRRTSPGQVTKEAGGSISSQAASEIEELKRKQRKLLQLVDKYEQLSSLHLTAMAKSDGIIADLQKRVLRLEKQVKVLGGETAVDFIALDAEKEKLLLENLALKEGLSSVEQKVRQARSRSRGGSRSGSDVEGSDDRMNQSGTSRGTRTASVSSSVSDEDVVLASQARPVATPSARVEAFDDFSVVKTSISTKGGDQTTLDDILTPEVVAEAERLSRSRSGDNTEEETSSFVEP